MYSAGYGFYAAGGLNCAVPSGHHTQDGIQPGYNLPVHQQIQSFQNQQAQPAQYNQFQPVQQQFQPFQQQLRPVQPQRFQPRRSTKDLLGKRTHVYMSFIANRQELEVRRKENQALNDVDIGRDGTLDSDFPQED
jgi:hypothetical protein